MSKPEIDLGQEIGRFYTYIVRWTWKLRQRRIGFHRGPIAGELLEGEWSLVIGPMTFVCWKAP